MPTPAGMTRQAAREQSRKRLLDAGMAILVDGLRSPIDGVRSTEVAQRAGYTPGAFYHHWPTQEDYRADLRNALNDRDELDDSTSNLTATLEDLPHVDVGGAELIRESVRREAEQQANDPVWHVQLAMLASSEPLDAVSYRPQYEAWIDEYADLYSAIFADVGVEVVDGVDLRWFVRTVMAMVEGYSLQIRAGVGLEACTGTAGTEHGWGTVELGFATLATGSLRRVDGRPTTGDDPLERLWSLLAD